MSTSSAASAPMLAPRLSDRMRSAPLPAVLTPVVGREQELALASELLHRQDVRLLTIIGPGGIGKTRLAVEVCRAQGGSHADGVFFVPLAAVADADQVAPAILRALGVQEAISVDDRESLLAVLCDADALLALDNFEHILPAAPLLTELLATCPQLKIVVTSRALLRVTGEYALPVPPLILPEPGGGCSAEDVIRSPSVRLFVDRVWALKPDFVLTEETAPLVAGICRHLDGLPLAIELAAAQAAVLPPAALFARIQARLPLPVTGPRDAPARLRTIADAVAWSYDLLTLAEQRLFRRLAVFAGGFALDAAEHVTEGAETLDLLSALVEKSLLRQEAWEGEARFMMLETIRVFARDQLVASGEADAIGDAHAAWALELAEQHQLAIVAPGGERQLARLERDHPNLLAALSWFEQRQHVEGLLCLAAALGGFWIAHNHYREGRDWLERALAGSLEASVFARGRAQISMGRLVTQFGEVERADRLLAEGIGALHEDHDAPLVAFALTRQATVANQLGDYGRAERLLNDALDQTDRIRDAGVSAAIAGTALANLGVAAHGRGDFELALARHEEALRICRELGYTLGAIRSLRDLGDVERDRGDLVRSLSHYREALELMGEQADLRVVVDALEGAALAAVAWQQPTAAARLLGAAEAFRELHGGAFIVPADQAAHERTLTAIRATLAEVEIDAAWTAGRQLSVAGAIAEIQALSPAAETAGSVSLSGVNLSPRETDVLRLLVAGLPDRAIAAELFVSVRTVEAHVARMLTKLGVRTRTAAVSLAITGGLVKPESPKSD